MVAMCGSCSSFIIPSRRLRQACQNQSSERITQNASRWDLNSWELPKLATPASALGSPSPPHQHMRGGFINDGPGQGQYAAYPRAQLDSPSRVHQSASLTVQVRPARSVPWSPAIAALAALRSGMSTNPKPYGWPVSRSVITLIVSTVPYDSKS